MVDDWLVDDWLGTSENTMLPKSCGSLLRARMRSSPVRVSTARQGKRNFLNCRRDFLAGGRNSQQFETCCLIVAEGRLRHSPLLFLL